MSSEVPDGWSQSTLGSLCVVKARIGWRGLAATEYTDDGAFLIAGKHIQAGEINWDACDHLSEERYDESPEIMLRLGDVVFSKDGSIGNPALIRWLPGPATINGTMMMLRADLTQLDPEFLFQFVRGPAFAQMISEKVSGSSIPHIFQRDIIHFPVLLPPLDEQRRIAEVLRSADEAVAASLSASKQSDLTLRIWMDAALNISSQAPPSHWRTVKIRELGRVQAGRQRAPSFTSGEVRPYLRVANVFDGYIDVGDVLTMPFTDREYSEYRLVPGDILLNEGQSLHLVGRAAVYDGQPANCCFQNTLVRFRAETVSPTFAYALTRTLYWTGKLSAIATQTTSVAHLGVSRFADLRVALPPDDEQEQIANTFVALSAAAETLKSAGVRLRQLRMSLVDDLLSGRVRVPA